MGCSSRTQKSLRTDLIYPYPGPAIAKITCNRAYSLSSRQAGLPSEEPLSDAVSEMLCKNQAMQQLPKVVVITGANAGVGRATAKAFAEHGADIGLLARDKDR